MTSYVHIHQPDFAAHQVRLGGELQADVWYASTLTGGGGPHREQGCLQYADGSVRFGAVEIVPLSSGGEAPQLPLEM